ncbi:peptidylprolyl isomerase [Bacillus tianshenii]|uniref:peptidylprolyl isomerase n=1 Tax=Sutcliffiella tianshenii TaxID=1463404 RepID=UPI001CD3733E|nr:peptidylprolyl isomerase [Bacillus tianshenii]MCA1321794.1 peptidylprolyl isomerase [Bacillus tianshenii]
MKKIWSVLMLALLLIVAGCGQGTSNNNETEGTGGGEEAAYEYDKKDDKVEITTSKGKIVVELYPDAAPKAVENFVTHATNGYYDGLIFHRVIQDFMIQTGDPQGTGIGGESIWGEPFEDEFSENHPHIKGALSMANSGPSTNGSQFFIVQASEVTEDMIAQMESAQFPAETIELYKEHGGTPWLDNKHTVFGQVVEGMDVVDAIAEVPVDGSAKPAEEIKIESMKLID